MGILVSCTTKDSFREESTNIPVVKSGSEGEGFGGAEGEGFGGFINPRISKISVVSDVDLEKGSVITVYGTNFSPGIKIVIAGVGCSVIELIDSTSLTCALDDALDELTDISQVSAQNPLSKVVTVTPVIEVAKAPEISPTPTPNFTGDAPTPPSLPFISVWDTTKSAPSYILPREIMLPLDINGTYNFSVDWGDGTTNTITTWDDLAKKHEYAVPGTYTVTITGTIIGFRFNNSAAKKKLMEIKQWGSLKLGNSVAYFSGAENLVITATDTLDLSGTINLRKAFRNCKRLTNIPNLNTWNTSAVTDMSYMFYGTAFDQDISFLNTSAVKSMSGMFAFNTAFNQIISGWNTANVTNMSLMFQNATSFNQDISRWATNKVSKMTGMFLGAALSQANYDALLIGWTSHSLKSNVIFDAGFSNYSAGAATQARDKLINSYFWIITDGGQN